MSSGDWILGGGALSIDFVNTLRDRWSSTPRETLTSSEDVVEWLNQAGVPTVSGRSSHERAITLRAALEALLEHRSTDAQHELINHASSHAPRPILVATAEGVTVRAPDEMPIEVSLGMVAADAVRLVSDDLLARVSICRYERCGLLFLDTSRGRRRLWCSMQRCGNRAKVARFDERRRASTT